MSCKLHVGSSNSYSFTGPNVHSTYLGKHCHVHLLSICNCVYIFLSLMWTRQEVYGIYYFRFGPHDVIHKLKDKGKVLGLVIDVNYSDKYYHKGVGIFVICYE